MESDLPLPHTLGRYTLTRLLGRGGMGVVYAARDERLERDVAVKMIAGLSTDEAIRRFWREARAAAAVNHPRVCQIYEVDEHSTGIYLAMELLEGESLEARLRAGAMPPARAIAVAIEVLEALDALHEHGFAHRDVKPSNVFLTAHGVKLLDFGLARPIMDETFRIDAASNQITRPGMVVGTPRYMAPEQVAGRTVDGRADIYAVGTLLFEMLAGRPPFASENVFGLAQAILNERPPALQGSPTVIQADHVIRRALEKDPGRRFAKAEAMAAELRRIPVTSQDQSGVIVPVRPLLRLLVLPLRLLREDPDAAFLSFGLAETVSGSLAGLRDVVVRSPALGAGWTSSDSDLRRLAAQADVDVVVSGSLTRMGDQLRATLQLVEPASGTVVGAATVRGQMAEIFAFEDQITQAVLGLLAGVRSGASNEAVKVDAPANGRAFEHFLRGLELARSMVRMSAARDAFQKALDEDPAFAPAWAWLGRSHRVIGKFESDYEENTRRAEEAFRRALALSPELPVAHRFFTHFESEHGRADGAIARLLQHARANRNDAHLFAALVHACRYAGLLGASMAAHEEAKRLDPTVTTSVEYTMLQLGDPASTEALSASAEEVGAHLYQLLFAGNRATLRERLDELDLSVLPTSYRGMVEALRTAESDPLGTLAGLEGAMLVGAVHDPEAVFLAGMCAACLGAPDRALEHLAAGVRDGFAAVHPLEKSPTLDALRSRPEFAAITEMARQRQRIALAIFERGQGPALLGIPAERAG